MRLRSTASLHRRPDNPWAELSIDNLATKSAPTFAVLRNRLDDPQPSGFKRAYQHAPNSFSSNFGVLQVDGIEPSFEPSRFRTSSAHVSRASKASLRLKAIENLAQSLARGLEQAARVASEIKKRCAGQESTAPLPPAHMPRPLQGGLRRWSLDTTQGPTRYQLSRRHVRCDVRGVAHARRARRFVRRSWDTPRLA